MKMIFLNKLNSVGELFFWVNINKGAWSLSFLLFNWEKFKVRQGVLSFLCYLTKNFSYFELLNSSYI